MRFRASSLESAGAPDDLVEAVAAPGNVLRHHQRQLVRVEHLEPLVPFDQFVAAGIGCRSARS